MAESDSLPLCGVTRQFNSNLITYIWQRVVYDFTLLPKLSAWHLVFRQLCFPNCSTVAKLVQFSLGNAIQQSEEPCLMLAGGLLLTAYFFTFLILLFACPPANRPLLSLAESSVLRHCRLPRVRFHSGHPRLMSCRSPLSCSRSCLTYFLRCFLFDLYSFCCSFYSRPVLGDMPTPSRLERPHPVAVAVSPSS